MPAEVVLDTSVVVEGLLPSQPDHRGAESFFERLAETGSVVFFSRLLELELAEATFRIALKERYGRRWARARYDGRARRRATILLTEVRAAWQGLLGVLAWARVEIEKVADDVPGIMSRYGLASYDAVHVATAFYSRAAVLATTDSAFSRVPEGELTLYVNDARVPRCREVHRALA